MNQIKYSFIIPVKIVNDYIREAVGKILEIKRSDYEILIYPDEANSETWPNARQIATGAVGPAAKRSLSIKDSQGEILIFIDDDAYPSPDFLDKLELDFIDQNISAVGGPALTPPNDSFWQKVSGAVFLSKLSGGFPERYASVGKKHFITDWPSVNLSVRKEAFARVGGFDCAYWPGEDTKLCLDLVEKLKGKILYDPELIVWHHRRSGLIRHLKQVANYGLHRGYFAKKYPQTSFKFKYFLPSLFVVFVLLGGIFSFFPGLILNFYVLGWMIYAAALLYSAREIHKYEKNILIVLNSLYYIFLTHLVYGARFIQGFFLTFNLRSKLRKV